MIKSSLKLGHGGHEEEVNFASVRSLRKHETALKALVGVGVTRQKNQGLIKN